MLISEKEHLLPCGAGSASSAFQITHMRRIVCKYIQSSIEHDYPARQLVLFHVQSVRDKKLKRFLKSSDSVADRAAKKAARCELLLQEEPGLVRNVAFILILRLLCVNPV